MTASGVTAIVIYKGLTRNPEIGNTPVCVFSNIWRLGRVRDTKFGWNVFNEKLLNNEKCQGYSFYRFLSYEEKTKPTEGGGGGGRAKKNCEQKSEAGI